MLIDYDPIFHKMDLNCIKINEKIFKIYIMQNTKSRKINQEYLKFAIQIDFMLIIPMVWRVIDAWINKKWRINVGTNIVRNIQID